MRVMIYGHGIEANYSLRDYVQRRLLFAFARFSTRIRKIGVRLHDVNGDRGGTDQCCRIMVRLIPTGTIVIEDIDEDLFTAIDRAADRAGRAVARELRRRWEVRRRAASRSRDAWLRQRMESWAFSHIN